LPFSEIELSPLTPYSGTYLGYAIDKGKLSLALKYLVDRKELSAENKVFLDQFTFGERIESGGLSADAVEISPAEESRWLKAVYEKEKFPRPRTIIGTLKSLPDSEMRKLIPANTVVGEQQLRQLARERAVAVSDFLVNSGNLSKERLFEKSADIFAPPAKEGGNGSRVEFGVVN